MYIKGGYMKDKSRSNTVEVFSGVLLFLIVSFCCIILLSLINYKFDINQRIIKIVTQILKAICLLIVCLIKVKGEKGLIKGGTIGVFCGILEYILFLIFGLISFSPLSFILEILYLLIVGGISGILAVNVKR